MIRKALLALLVLVALPVAARATVCVLPNTIVNGAIIDATPVQQNFAALEQCFTQIDWTNIDATGIYASQIIPISPGTATFGGSQRYTFATTLIASAGIVVDSSAPPSSGIAGGNATTPFLITSNAGSGASSAFDLIGSTTLGGSHPQLTLTVGAIQFFAVSNDGDVEAAGGIAFDGRTPDGSSLIGGAPVPTALPFYLISKAGAGAGGSFVIRSSSADSADPAIVFENGSNTVIDTLAYNGSLGLGNNTPPPSPGDLAGGGPSGHTPFYIVSNTTNSSIGAFEIGDGGTGNAAIVQFDSATTNNVASIDEHGGMTFGAAGTTFVEPTSAAFQGSVAVPTVGPMATACTNGSSQLIACGNGSTNVIAGTVSLGSTSCSASDVCPLVTVATSAGVTTAMKCLVNYDDPGTTGIAISSVVVSGANTLEIRGSNVQTSTQTFAGTLFYRCSLPGF